MDRPPKVGAGDDSPENVKTVAFTPCVVRQSTTSGLVTPSPIKGRVADGVSHTSDRVSHASSVSSGGCSELDSGRSSHGSFHVRSGSGHSGKSTKKTPGVLSSGSGIAEAQIRRAALQAESFKNATGAEARIMKELDEGPVQVAHQKEMLEAREILEAELELTPFVIKVQRAFRLVKFVYMKFGPLLFVDSKAQSSYGQVKFREVLKPASWISVAPNVSARRLVKF